MSEMSEVSSLTMGVKVGTSLNMGVKILQGSPIILCWNSWLHGHIPCKIHYVNYKVRDTERKQQHHFERATLIPNKLKSMGINFEEYPFNMVVFHNQTHPFKRYFSNFQHT